MPYKVQAGQQDRSHVGRITEGLSAVSEATMRRKGQKITFKFLFTWPNCFWSDRLLQSNVFRNEAEESIRMHVMFKFVCM